MNNSTRVVIWFSCAILATYVLYEQVFDRFSAPLALSLERHQELVKGESTFFNPWQYRVLAIGVVEGMIQGTESLGIAPHVSNPYLDEYGIDLQQHFPLLLVRWIQHFLIFLVALMLYQKMGISHPWLSFIGVMLLAHSMARSNFGSDLSFNTYFDLLFYLLGAWCILSEKYVGFMVVVFLAALNRESSGFLPLMLAIMAIQGKPLNIIQPKKVKVAALSMGIFVGVFIGIRLWLGYQAPNPVYDNESFMDYLLWNLTNPITYPQLLTTFGVMPLIALVGYRAWPSFLTRWFWLVIPAWVVIHFGFSIARETRLFLVPMGLIFIPGVLFLVQLEVRQKRISSGS
ncbi:MAG: hypothetical protein AAGI38_04565 [Bacteroidota bacterium]